MFQGVSLPFLKKWSNRQTDTDQCNQWCTDTCITWVTIFLLYASSLPFCQCTAPWCYHELTSITSLPTWILNVVLQLAACLISCMYTWLRCHCYVCQKHKLLTILLSLNNTRSNFDGFSQHIRTLSINTVNGMVMSACAGSKIHIL